MFFFVAIFENLWRDGHFTLRFPKNNKKMMKKKMKKTKKNGDEEERIEM